MCIRDRYRGWLEYCTDLFEQETIVRMRDHLLRVLEWMVGNPEGKLRDLSLLSEAERRLIVHDWNDTARPFERHLSLPALIARQVERTPEAPAVVYERETLSYGELDQRANQLAHLLRSRGVGRGSFVGLYLTRSAEMVVALLAVLKAGAAYLPVSYTHLTL